MGKPSGGIGSSEKLRTVPVRSGRPSGADMHVDFVSDQVHGDAAPVVAAMPTLKLTDD